MKEDAQLRYDLAMKRADRNHALQEWAKQCRPGANDDAVLLGRLAELLAPVLEYVASKGNPSAMGIRAWCLLYATRPDLINHETFAQGAAHFGVSQENMIYHFARLKKVMPGFEFVKRATPTTGVLKTRMLKANAARVAQQKAAKAKAWALREKEDAREAADAWEAHATQQTRLYTGEEVRQELGLPAGSSGRAAA